MSSTSNKRIALSEPSLVGNVRSYLEECVATNFVSSVGPFVERFERAFADFVGSRYAVACATGTAAIHVALRLLDVTPEDEIFVPTLTFIASANPIAYERAQPVFVDSERQTFNLNPVSVVAEIERRASAGERMPRAVEVVHLLGHPANIEPIVDVCARHGIPVIEDAAEALGATYTEGRFAGKQVGSIGLLGCFSFNGNKILTCGGGGMITTDDEKLARRAKHLTTQARLPGAEYRHDEVGYNYRMTNVAAAIGLAQLECMPDFLARKRAIAARYDAALANHPVLMPAVHASWAHPSFWLYSVMARTGGKATRDRILANLAEVGIEARPIWSPLHTMPMYEKAARLSDGSVAESLAASSFSLPCSVGLSDEDQERVIAVLKKELT
ncbi:aminotransferase class I/II-fold pyridoxal phosphate-dependent enzyme [Pendulispora brunnea]|uniref:Aminotransferase class I/II-fold pyridoxal phosphate-dependent enzyme n=1 Tax=Pendulispora brunnea TaxID=2905690 RepID=A0ABZ2KIT5_9BACT